MSVVMWVPMPKNHDDLPWDVKAGKTMMWFYDFKDRMRGSRGIHIGRWCCGQYIQGAEDSGGINIDYVTHYAERPAAPDGKPYSAAEDRLYRMKGVDYEHRDD